MPQYVWVGCRPSLDRATTVGGRRLAGWYKQRRLNRVNADITAAVYQRLQLRENDRVLEIGFGNGRLLPALLACAEDLTYVGLDIAETMVTEAIAFNAGLVAAGQASFRLASAEAIPCPDESFDFVRKRQQTEQITLLLGSQAEDQSRGDEALQNR